VAAGCSGFSWECWQTAPEDVQEAAEIGVEAGALAAVAVGSADLVAGVAGAAAPREAGSTWRKEQEKCFPKTQSLRN